MGNPGEGVIPPGSSNSVAFWAVGALVALYEPPPFLLDLAHPQGLAWATGFVAARLFLFNLAGAWYFRKSGFLSALSLRWRQYLVWHVVGQSLLGLH
jgi:hypothetical protein